MTPDWKKTLEWICAVRDGILHRKHMAAWRSGAYGDVPAPGRNGFSVSARETKAGLFVVEVSVLRKERCPVRKAWTDRVASKVSRESMDDAYYGACERMLRVWEPLGPGVTPEEAFARMEFSGEAEGDKENGISETA